MPALKVGGWEVMTLVAEPKHGSGAGTLQPKCHQTRLKCHRSNFYATFLHQSSHVQAACATFGVVRLRRLAGLGYLPHRPASLPRSSVLLDWLRTIFIIPDGINLLFILHHFFLQFTNKCNRHLIVHSPSQSTNCQDNTSFIVCPRNHDSKSSVHLGSLR